MWGTSRPGRWEPCRTVIIIERRGPVRCWKPPLPGQELCEEHAREAEGEKRPAPSAIGDFVVGLLGEISPDSRIIEFTETPAGKYALRVETRPGTTKSVLVAKPVIDSAVTDPSSLTNLRTILRSVLRAVP